MKSVELRVKLLHCVFKNTQNHYYVWKSKKMEAEAKPQVDQYGFPTQPQPTTVIFDGLSNVPPTNSKVTIDIEAQPVTHKTYGVQYKVIKWNFLNDETNMERALCSTPGFGKKSADKLIAFMKQTYPDGDVTVVDFIKSLIDTYETLFIKTEHVTTRICKCRACVFVRSKSREMGIPVNRVESLLKHWQKMLDSKDAAFLDLGLVPKEIKAIQDKAKYEQTHIKPSEIRANPWLLRQLLPRKFTMRRCDEIAKRAKFQADHPKRIEQHGSLTLRQLNQVKGHMFAWLDILCKETWRSLNNSVYQSLPHRDAILATIKRSELFVIKEHPDPSLGSKNKRVSKKQSSGKVIVFDAKVYKQKLALCATLASKIKTKSKRVWFETICELARQKVGKFADSPIADLEPDLCDMIASQLDTGHPLGPPLAHPHKLDIEIGEFETQNMICFDDEQTSAIRSAINQPCTIITGGPGMGKTTIIRAITEILRKHIPTNAALLLTSFTGQAVRRIREVVCGGNGNSYEHMKSDGFKIRTMHSFIYSDVLSYLTEETPVYLIIDELSMVSEELFAHMIKKFSKNLVKLVIVGDQDQLPSIDPGSLLRDLIASRCIPTVVLKTIHRQKRNGTLVLNAKVIRDANTAEIYDQSIVDELKPSDDFCLIGDKGNMLSDAEYCRKITNIVKGMFTKYGPDFLMENLVILTPFRRTQHGKYYLDNLLRQFFNASISNYPAFIVKMRPRNGEGTGTQRASESASYTQEARFYIGDRIIATKNDNTRLIFNGQPGRIVDLVDTTRAPSQSTEEGDDNANAKHYVLYQGSNASYRHLISRASQNRVFSSVVAPNNLKKMKVMVDPKIKWNAVAVKFDGQGEIQMFIGDELSDLEIHYASTVHKAQGDEKKFVIVFVPSLFAPSVCSRELLYTAITRAKTKCYLLGNYQSILKCIINKQNNQRLTCLKYEMRNAFVV